MQMLLFQQSQAHDATVSIGDRDETRDELTVLVWLLLVSTTYGFNGYQESRGWSCRAKSTKGMLCPFAEKEVCYSGVKGTGK